MNKEELREKIRDTGAIIQNILNQPLYMQDATGHFTLLQAAESYTESDMALSDLRQVTFSFIDYPEPTEVLLTELDLLTEDLSF